MLKQLIERLSGCRIYRDTLPHGTDLYKDIKKVRDPLVFRTVFDIGSNRGQSVSEYLKAFPKANIFGFEPSIESMENLRGLYSSEERVRLYQTAVSDADGEALLYLKEADSTHSLIQDSNTIGSQCVKTTMLDSFCSEAGLAHIDFCKIDTEGHDLSVLKGAVEMLQQQRISFVQVETSTRVDVSYFCRLPEIEQFMTRFGYELFGMYDQQPCWSGRHSLIL
jgi:FkbM family methyltransferase